MQLKGPHRGVELCESGDESDCSLDGAVNFVSDPLASCYNSNPSPEKKSIKKYTNKDGEEWAKSQQKKNIIAALLDKDSCVQDMTPAEIFDQYAAGHGWIKKNATANIRRLTTQFLC